MLYTGMLLVKLECSQTLTHESLSSKSEVLAYSFIYLFLTENIKQTQNLQIQIWPFYLNVVYLK